MKQGMILILFSLLGISQGLHAATLKEGHYLLKVSYQDAKERVETFAVSEKSVNAVRLYYSRESDLKTEQSQNYLDVHFEDITSMTVVEQAFTGPFLATVILTDGGGLLMGYVPAQGTLFQKEEDRVRPFDEIYEVSIKTDIQKDTRDSREYYLEYSREYLWHDVRVGDTITYYVSTTKEIVREVENPERVRVPYKYYETLTVSKIDDVSVTFTLSSSDQKETEQTLLFKSSPDLKNLIQILPVKKVSLNAVFIEATTEKRNLETEAFQFKMDLEDGTPVTTSISPSLFPLAFAENFSGVIDIKTKLDDPVRKVVSVNRLRDDRQASDEFTNLTQEEKQKLLSEIRVRAKALFTALQQGLLTAENLDEFIDLDHLYVRIDGFPLAFSEEMELEEKLKQLRDRVDDHFESLEKDLMYLSAEEVKNRNALNAFEKEIRQDAEINEYVMLLDKLEKAQHEEDLKPIIEKLGQLNQSWSQQPQKTADISRFAQLKAEYVYALNQLNAAESSLAQGHQAKLKEEEAKLRRIFQQQHRSRKRVLSAKLNSVFRENVPFQFTADDFENFAQFELYSESRATMSVPGSSLKVGIRLTDSQWKIGSVTN